ncbi:MAG: DUF2135 domain-containing protein [Bacteroidetes bacterium]|nr:DUF2135 domain-containing protein [Bacteroidota bacterium]
MNKVVTLILFLAVLFSSCKTRKAISESEIPQTKPSQEEMVLDENFPVVMIKEPGDTVSIPLAMSELKVSVKVAGNIAITTMEMVFSNHLDRILEGQLYFPLGEGQTISRFAMDVNGKLREGVVVEKEKGRVAYENTVRQTIDPGLLEWVKGNNFKARIYPVPAKGHKRIIIAYEQELTHEPEGWVYLLPMNFKDTVEEFSLSIQVLKQQIKPRFEKSELANLSFEQWEESYLAEEVYHHYLPDKQLGILIPRNDENRHAWTEAGEDNSRYFYLSILPEIVRREKKAPKRIVILWDHSHSANHRKTDLELDVLDSYLQQIGNVDVLLVPFSNALDPSAGFQVKSGNWAELREEITALPNDGATQFGVLDLTLYSPDEFILFSDGNSNFGSSAIKTGSRPVYVINSSATGNHPFLNFIASSTGGQYMNLASVTRDAALRMLTYQSFRFLSAEYQENEVKQLYPSFSTPVNGDFSMSGKIVSDKATITLNFGIGEEILYRKMIEIDPTTQDVKGMKLDRIWAQKKLAELMVREDENEAEMIQLGKRFSIITPHTSLIVLDRVEDYVEHEIVPPPELLSTYEELIAERNKNREIELFSHLDQVAENFAIRKDWWNQKFKIPKRPIGDTIQGRSNTTPRLLEENNSDEDWGSSMEEDGGFDDFSAAEDSDSDGFGDLMDSFDEEPALEAKVEEDEKDDFSNSAGTIKLNVWNPETPYTKELSEGPPAAFYTTYLKLKKEYASTPAFFLDVANLAFQKGDSAMALRILSNIAELELENHELLRVLARRLQQLKEYSLAISMFEEIIKIRGEEPQSYRDMGLVLAETGKYQESLDMLYEVVKRPWDGRFPNIGSLVAHEMNGLIGRSGKKLDLAGIDKRLVADLPTDIRVVLDWDADAVDMDLWVIDPRGEKCYYQNQRTAIGGFMSSDFTGGYGPEEYLLKAAMKGTYKVQVNYYGSNQQRIAGPTNIQMRLITNYGKPNEKTQSITMRLASESEVIDVGELVFE